MGKNLTNSASGTSSVALILFFSFFWRVCLTFHYTSAFFQKNEFTITCIILFLTISSVSAFKAFARKKYNLAASFGIFTVILLAFIFMETGPGKFNETHISLYLLTSLLISLLFYRFNSKEKVEKQIDGNSSPDELASSEEIKRETYTPSGDSVSFNDVNFDETFEEIKKNIVFLKGQADKFEVEENYDLETSFENLKDVANHYSRIRDSQKDSAKVYIESILNEIRNQIEAMYEKLDEEELHEIRKYYLKYKQD